MADTVRTKKHQISYSMNITLTFGRTKAGISMVIFTLYLGGHEVFQWPFIVPSDTFGFATGRHVEQNVKLTFWLNSLF